MRDTDLFFRYFVFLKRFPRHSLILEAFAHATWSYLQSLNYYSPGGSSSAACWGSCGPSHRVSFLISSEGALLEDQWSMMTIHSTPSNLNEVIKSWIGFTTALRIVQWPTLSLTRPCASQYELIKPQMIPGRPPINVNELRWTKTERQQYTATVR